MAKTFLEKFEERIFNTWIVSNNYYFYLIGKKIIEIVDVFNPEENLIYYGYYVQKTNKRTFLRSKKIVINKTLGFDNEKVFKHETDNAITLSEALNTFVLKDPEIKHKLTREFSKYLLNERN